MWRVVIFCVLCFQIFERNALETQGTDDDKDLFSKIKGKLGKVVGTSTLKKAKLESIYLEPENETITADELGLPAELANDTIKKDHHRYYNSTFYGTSEMGKLYWIDFDELPEAQVITNKMLSNSYRQATTIELTFDFPFYGSLLRNITVATGGFLYMGDYMHNWIAATQYIAPLMANFDTTLSENSTVKYVDNGTAFTVHWNNVFIKDRAEDGDFTFQVTLYQNGDICFAYKEIPFPISEISDEVHPVKIGISDAYILERNVFFIRRKTIYEYHRVDMMKNVIGNNTAIFFTALPTCLNFNNCESCMDADKSLECVWCNPVQRCSDGIDRQRQSWIVEGCAIEANNMCSTEGPEHPLDVTTSKSGRMDNTKTSKAIETSSKRIGPEAFSTAASTPNEILQPDSDNKSSEKGGHEVAPYIQQQLDVQSSSSLSIGAVITIVIFIAVMIGIGTWIFYAYRFPQSSAGQFLIKYRPSQWHFKQDDRSVNVDSFHM